MSKLLYHILFPTVEPLLGHRPSPTLFLLWCGLCLATGSSCAWPPASGRAGLWQPQAVGFAGWGLCKTGVRCEEQLSCDEGGQMPREAVGPPSLEVFGTRMDTALSTLTWVLWAGVRNGDGRRLLPAQTYSVVV